MAAGQRPRYEQVFSRPRPVPRARFRAQDPCPGFWSEMPMPRLVPRLVPKLVPKLVPRTRAQVRRFRFVRYIPNGMARGRPVPRNVFNPNDGPIFLAGRLHAWLHRLAHWNPNATGQGAAPRTPSPLLWNREALGASRFEFDTTWVLNKF
jgi:hypothetical protein